MKPCQPVTVSVMGNVTNVCAECGAEMQGRADRKYCSAACRQKAHRGKTRAAGAGNVHRPAVVSAAARQQDQGELLGHLEAGILALEKARAMVTASLTAQGKGSK